MAQSAGGVDTPFVISFGRVDRPRQRRLRGLLDFVAEAEAAALSDLAQLTELTLDGLTRLVPHDHALCVEWRRSTGPPPTPTATDPDFVAARLRDPELWLTCISHHPLVTHWQRTGGGAAVRFSDVIGQRAYRRLPIYHSFFRPFGVEYDVGASVFVSSQREIDLFCMRQHRDFSDDERALLEALRPYLGAIFRRAEVGAPGRALRSAFGLSDREGEVLALVARGQSNREVAATLLLSPLTVRKHLERIYAKLGVTTRTQASARARDAYDNRPQPLDELLGTASSPLDAFRVTGREAEVLALVAQGLSNAQIAATLRLAPGTVKKHLEHLYGKLGVSRRSEAAARAFGLGLFDTLEPPTQPATRLDTKQEQLGWN